jgi:hypothetical protein
MSTLLRVIAVLEDDARRHEAMERLLSEHCAAYTTMFFDNAPDMIAWLPANLPHVALICLDHDLGPNQVRDGEVFDPGTGRDVVNQLCLYAPSCLVIVHTSNYLAAPGMMLALEEAGWDVARAVPFDDLVWLTREWLPIRDVV